MTKVEISQEGYGLDTAAPERLMRAIDKDGAAAGHGNGTSSLSRIPGITRQQQTACAAM